MKQNTDWKAKYQGAIKEFDDKALKIIAKMMVKQTRKSDFVYRIGGEEFVLLLTNTDVSKAELLVEKLRNAVNHCEFHFNQERVLLSLSAGITETRDEDDVESIFERADSALYRAKNSGRNCQFVAWARRVIIPFRRSFLRR